MRRPVRPLTGRVAAITGGARGIGLAIGLGMGLLYSSAQRPECGYGGDLICW